MVSARTSFIVWKFYFITETNEKNSGNALKILLINSALTLTLNKKLCKKICKVIVEEPMK